MYEWARKLTIDKRVCADVLPSRGIIAGCASATTVLKAFMYRSCSFTIARNPKVSTSIFIDDLTIDGQGKKGEVFENVVHAAKGLIGICEDDLRMPIGRNKLAVVASDDLLVVRVGKRFGSQHYAQSQARILGVGLRAGKAKHKGQCATTKRWNKAGAKGKHARIISKVTRKGASKLFFTVVVPAMAYGAHQNRSRW